MKMPTRHEEATGDSLQINYTSATLGRHVVFFVFQRNCDWWRTLAVRESMYVHDNIALNTWPHGNALFNTTAPGSLPRFWMLSVSSDDI